MTNLHATAASLAADGKGILAADESIKTMSARLAKVGVEGTETNRRDYRELLLTTPGLSQWVAGIILCDETLRQLTADGTPFPQRAAALGVQAGIKVDTGTTTLPFSDGETVTQGLDGLAERLAEYRELGATFAKWRAVLQPGASDRAFWANAHALARYAALCQDAGIVPIVEPEVLMDGGHPIEACQATTAAMLSATFSELDRAGVDPAGVVLKPNMVIAGTAASSQSTPKDVARQTVAVLRDKVPAQVPSIAFLSGGQSNERACANLAEINRQASQVGVPWRLTFSFGRALVDDALRTWAGQPGQVAQAQQALAANCSRASAAAQGRDEGVV
ncbi:MAG: fructose-bisphosphate aldolase class I [Propionibacteriaceae bacterium]|nr:fructose-bisphosphate aldolase class I [Propionibacteriaceae bacterium]